MKKVYCDICGKELMKSCRLPFSYEYDLSKLPQSLWMKMTLQCVATAKTKRFGFGWGLGDFPEDFCLGCIRRIVETVERMQEEQAKKTPPEDPEKSELREKAEQYKSQLEIITKGEFKKRCDAVLKRAKTIIKDSNRIKLIEKKLRTPENLKSLEFILDTLEHISKTD